MSGGAGVSQEEMAIPEQFSLRWNDFHSNLSQGFHALLEGEDLVDVTLAAGGQYVHAHKLILSVCSPYFKELFKMNPCEHPIVILKDVALSELRQLLQFMYKGEVHVRRQELSGFLHTAELLQVKGLTAGRERSESPQGNRIKEDIATVKNSQSNDSLSNDWVPGIEEPPASVSPVPPSSTPQMSEEDATRSPLKRLLKNTPTKMNVTAKKKPRPAPDTATPENIEYASDGEPLLDFDSELYHSILEMPDCGKDSLIKQDGGWNCKPGGVKCPSCNRFFANRYNLKVHIRDKHDTLEGTLQCDICHKRMRNPSCLRVHMYHHRKQAAFLAAQLSAAPHADVTKANAKANVSGKWRHDSSLPLSPLPATEIDKKSNSKWQSNPVSPSATSDGKEDKKSNANSWQSDPPSPNAANDGKEDGNSGGEDTVPPTVDIDIADGVSLTYCAKFIRNH